MYHACIVRANSHSREREVWSHVITFKWCRDIEEFFC